MGFSGFRFQEYFDLGGDSFSTLVFSCAGVSHRVHMTTLRVFSGVPEELEQIAEEHRASYGMSHMLQQQYVMGGWDATWGGMSAEDINALNQGPNSGVDEASRCPPPRQNTEK
jgi:hypothetical protein